MLRWYRLLFPAPSSCSPLSYPLPSPSLTLPLFPLPLSLSTPFLLLTFPNTCTGFYDVHDRSFHSMMNRYDHLQPYATIFTSRGTQLRWRTVPTTRVLPAPWARKSLGCYTIISRSPATAKRTAKLSWATTTPYHAPSSVKPSSCSQLSSPRQNLL